MKFTVEDVALLDEVEAAKQEQKTRPEDIAEYLRQEQEEAANLVDPRSPAQKSVEMLGDATARYSQGSAPLTADIIMGVSKGRAGVKQGLDTAVSKMEQGFSYFLGEEYDAEEQARIREQSITQPEIVKQEVYAAARKKLTGDKPNFIATLAGEALATGMIGPQVGAGVLTRLFQSAATGGIAGGMEFTEGGDSERAVNTLFGSSVSTGMDALLRVGGPLVRMGSRMWKATLGDLIQTDKIDLKERLSKPEVAKVIKAAEDLGIVVTPAEASGELILISGQNELVINTATREELAAFIIQRNEDLTEGLLSLQKVADRDMGAVGSKLDQPAPFTGEPRDNAPFISFSDSVEFKQTREQVYSRTLDKKEFRKLIEDSPNLNKLINDYKAALKANPDKRTSAQVLALSAVNDLKKGAGLPSGFPVENVGFLDLMLKRFDANLPSGLGTTQTAASDIRLTSKERNAISTKLKEKIPGYSDLKAREQRMLAVNDVKKALDPTASQQVNIQNFYNTLLKDKKARVQLLRKLSTDKGAQKKVNDLALVLDHIFSDASIAKKITSTEADGTVSATVFSNLRGYFANDKGVINLITNPKWQYDISKLKGRTPEATLVALSNYLGRVVSVADAAENKVGFKEEEQPQQ